MRLTLTLLACLSVVASANIIGFDLGSNFFKITLVKPGNPFKIVENVTSMRKTHSQLTIGAEQRLYGKDSFLAATKTPKTTFSDVLRQLGKEFS